MRAAWEAALARYPQVTSLEDPMLGGTIGPASIGSRDVDFAWRLEVSQKLPFPGKLALKGQGAVAEAGAAAGDIDDMRLTLSESAKSAFYDYYLAGQLLVINAESARLLKDFKENAQARYKTGQVTQQDVLQAEVEIGRQKERLLELEQMEKIARARINTLLHQGPETPLPPPGKADVPAALPDPKELRDQAVARRPDLQALSQRIAVEQANLGLALKEQYPDVEVMAAYDAFWQRPEQDLRTMLGLKVNLPVRVARRQGAIVEAQAKLAQRRAELEKQVAQVHLQVQEAHLQTEKNAKVVALYDTTILPAAVANVKAAQSAYVTGKIPFLSLVEAQRNLIMLRERHDEAVVNTLKGHATLERVSGAPLGEARKD
jgi:outer membrane protein TolC